MEDRLEALEVKLAFVEHHLGQLDELVRTALARLDRIEVDLAAVREELDVAAQRGGLEAERPPHHG